MGEALRVVSDDGTPIACRTSGSGEPLVLVHGTGTTGGDWGLVLPFLRDHFTVVAMDRRGRAGSGDADAYAMEREVEDVLAVLDAVRAELLVGHSYGALCSIRAAERTDRLRRLALYEPPIGVLADRLGPLDALLDRGDFEAALRGFLSTAGVPADQLGAISASAVWPSLLATAPTISRELHAAAGWRHPAEPIDVPTLLITGADTTSSVYLDGLEGLRAALSDHLTATIPGQRHIAHIDAPEDFARRLTEFLRS